LQGGELFGVGFFGLLEVLDDGGEWAVVGGFVGEVVEVIIAVGVEKAESGEVAFGAELFGGSGEEEEAVGMLGEGIDELVVGAGLLGGPLEVVCFVDDDEVPAGVDGLLGSFWVLAEELDATEDELVIEERVCIKVALFDGLAAFLVEDGGVEVKAAEHFDEPLIDEGFGDEDECAGGAATEEEAVEDEAGFDGFAEADFIGEEDPGGVAGGDGVGDVELMGDEIDSGADETPDWGAALVVVVASGLGAEVVGFEGVEGGGEEAVFGVVLGEGIGEFGLRDGVVICEVGNEVLGFLEAGDEEGGA
jgi:hypothetical protein